MEDIECPRCGNEEANFWEEYDWIQCEWCGLEGKVTEDDCPYCEDKLKIVGNQVFCKNCGLEKSAEELRQIQISEFEEDKEEIEELMGMFESRR